MGEKAGPRISNFLRIAQGSLKELETHLLIAERIGIAASPTDRRNAGESRERRQATRGS